MDEATIRKWYAILKDDKELVEIRILDPASRRTYSGYFKDVDTLISAIRPFDNCAIYFTLNVIDEACYSREQHDKISLKPKSTTSDNEIIARKWVLIDIDCEKPSDTNSTDEEKELAKQVVNNVYKFLRDEGFEKPIICDSANGWHILLKQAMIANAENTETMKKFLQVLDMYFSTDKVKIDITTYNNSRICKLYGTYSRKGANTKERPQRCSGFIRIPDEIKITPNEYFEKVASYYPEPYKKDSSNDYGASNFDLDSFINQYGIKVFSKSESQAYTKYVLETCPFNSAHRHPDSAIFKMRDGSIGFRCLHSSCSHYTWKDVRLKFDPHAYDRKDYKEYQHKQRYYTPISPIIFEPVRETPDKGKKWLNPKSIKRKREEDIVAIPTGYTCLDKAIRGLMLGETTILSGINGSGKSSWLNSLILNVAQRGFKVALFSGELTDFNVMKWLSLSAAGKAYVNKIEGSDYAYEVADREYNKIADWLDDKFVLFNNNYGNRVEQILSDIKDIIEQGVKLVVIDNLMSVSISNLGGDKNERQKQFILDVVEFAKKYEVHIILVCHPRKESGSQTLLRKESISGSSDLANAVQNIFIIHRCGEDFEKRASEFFGKDKASKYMEFDNVLEVCKNRSYGVVDYLVGMYYEVETKRFKNYKAEHIVYGWQDDPVPPMIAQEEKQDINALPFQPFYGEAPF